MSNQQLRKVMPATFRQRRTDYPDITERMAITTREALRNAIGYEATKALIWGIVSGDDYWFVISHNGEGFPNQQHIEEVLQIAVSGGDQGISGSGMKTSAWMMAPTDRDFCFCIFSRCLDGTIGGAQVTASSGTQLDIRQSPRNLELLKSRLGDRSFGEYTVHYMMRAPLAERNSRDRGGVTKVSNLRAAVDYTPFIFENPTIEISAYHTPVNGLPVSQGGVPSIDAVIAGEIKRNINSNRGDRQLTKILSKSAFERLYSDREFRIPFANVPVKGKEGYKANISGYIRIPYFKGEINDIKYNSLQVQNEEEGGKYDANQLINQNPNRYHLTFRLGIEGVDIDQPGVSYARMLEDPIWVRATQGRSAPRSQMGGLGMALPSTFKDDNPYLTMEVVVTLIDSYGLLRDNGQFEPLDIDVNALWAIVGSTNEFMLATDSKVVLKMIENVIDVAKAQNLDLIASMREYHETLFPVPDIDFVPLFGGEANARRSMPVVDAFTTTGMPIEQFEPGTNIRCQFRKSDGSPLGGLITIGMPEVRHEGRGNNHKLFIPPLSRYDQESEQWVDLEDEGDYDRHCTPKKILTIENAGVVYRVRQPINVPVIGTQRGEPTGRARPREQANADRGKSRPGDSYYDGSDNPEEVINWNHGVMKLNRTHPKVKNTYMFDHGQSPNLLKRCESNYHRYRNVCQMMATSACVLEFSPEGRAQCEEVFETALNYQMNRAILSLMNEPDYCALEQEVLALQGNSIEAEELVAV